MSAGGKLKRHAAGFSAPRGEIPQAWLNGGWKMRRYGRSQALTWVVPWSPSCLNGSELHVFRAAVVSIALTLAIGQNAVLLCQAWCDPHEAAATGCHHNTATSPSLTDNDNCTDTFAAIAFVREDLRRGTSFPDAQHAVLVPAFRFAPPSTDIRSGHDPGQQSPLESRPLVTPLRI